MQVNNPVPGANCQTQKSGTKQERLGESVTMTMVPLFCFYIFRKQEPLRDFVTSL
jgi:hypothetical protein